MVEDEGISFEEALSRKSNMLSDYDRNLRLIGIVAHAESLVENVCVNYGANIAKIACSNLDINEDISEVYLSKDRGKYEIGLDHSFFKEFVTFNKSKKEGVSFKIVEKGRKSSGMIYNYQNHPNITFDALIRILTVASKIAQEDMNKRVVPKE
ncbi:MAG: hypothetical protein XD93_1182 [candidate division WS6 bacterium 34_10]|jgi:hypothetical protein|uniref:Uncharacterized protein n=1 Tax=candidate division WS6 bacterium 34_10 TaxID=1641389 RepID=A0A101HFJ3_9BACT|nr:MAG: hypothetical protein XD93_1182 [candidate division WS6 bacterium 34_10]